MAKTIRDSVQKSWAPLISKIRTQTQQAYHRALNLDNRIHYVNNVILASVWYTAQIFPPTTDCVRQMNTAIQWFLWKGAIFKVPLSTLHLPKEEGGRALVHTMAKCVSLFITQIELQKQRTHTFTRDWLSRWQLLTRPSNPPNMKQIPAKFDYLYRYNIEAAYVPLVDISTTKKARKRICYTSLLHSIRKAADTPDLRIKRLWPTTDWSLVWTNVQNAPINEQMRCTWYHVIHDIIPTNERLHRIKIVPSEMCQGCTKIDTLLHRLTDCGEGIRIWQYMKTRLALILRTTPSRIRDDWLLRPQLKLWPEKKRNAVMWMLANVVEFSCQHRNTLSLQDFMEYLLRTRWKLLSHQRGRRQVGNYLTVLDQM